MCRQSLDISATALIGGPTRQPSLNGRILMPTGQPWFLVIGGIARPYHSMDLFRGVHNIPENNTYDPYPFDHRTTLEKLIGQPIPPELPPGRHFGLPALQDFDSMNWIECGPRIPDEWFLLRNNGTIGIYEGVSEASDTPLFHGFPNLDALYLYNCNDKLIKTSHCERTDPRYLDPVIIRDLMAAAVPGCRLSVGG